MNSKQTFEHLFTVKVSAPVSTISQPVFDEDLIAQQVTVGDTGSYTLPTFKALPDQQLAVELSLNSPLPSFVKFDDSNNKFTFKPRDNVFAGTYII